MGLPNLILNLCARHWVHIWIINHRKYEMKIKTNNQPRFTIDACELTPIERLEFDYLDWVAIDEGGRSNHFLRYKGWVYDLGEFILAPASLNPWQAISLTSAFTGVLIKYVGQSTDRVIVGSYYS